MKEILAKYLGQDIGINYKEVKKYHKARLTAVTDESFTVVIPDNGISCTYPMRWVLNILEGDGGISMQGVFSSKRYPVLVEVFHLVVYSGAVGIGVSF